MSMQKNVTAILPRLERFTTRFRAKKDLVGLGKDAIPAIADALRNVRDEGTIWSLISALGEIADPAAATVLREYLHHPQYGVAAQEALQQITRHNPGISAHPVKDHAVSHEKSLIGNAAAPANTAQPHPAPVAPASPVPLAQTYTPEALVHALCLDTSMNGSKIRDDKYEVSVTLPGGRKQKVYMKFEGKDRQGDDLINVYTECGPANDKFLKIALQHNLRIPYCSIGVGNHEGKDIFMVVGNCSLKDANPKFLRKIVEEIAHRGDSMEKALTGKDLK